MISESDVHVWQAAIEPLARQIPTLSRLLSESERSRSSAFFHQRDRERFIVSHGVLRVLLAEYLQSDPAQIQFAEESRRKPCLAAPFSQSGLQFNITHSGELALLAFAHQRRVGVDVEVIRPLPDLEQIAVTTFSTQENQNLLALPSEERIKAFYTIWARKEALVKATGDGLYFPLKAFSVNLGIPPEITFHQSGLTHAQWQLAHLQVAPDHAAALALEGQGWNLTQLEYHP